MVPEKGIPSSNETSSDDDSEEDTGITLKKRGSGSIALRKAIKERPREIPPERPGQDKEPKSWYKSPGAEREVKDTIESLDSMTSEEAKTVARMQATELKRELKDGAQVSAEQDDLSEEAIKAGDTLYAEFLDNIEESGDIEGSAQKTAEFGDVEIPDLDPTDLKTRTVEDIDPDAAELEDLEESEEAETEPNNFDDEPAFEYPDSEASAEDYEDADDTNGTTGHGPGGGHTGAGGTGGAQTSGTGGTGGGGTGGHGGPGGGGPGPGAGGGVPHGPGGGPGWAGPNAPHAGGPGANFNFAPPAPAAVQSAESIDRGSPAVFFVAGGIIGYLIGRRRGRIKTEKKLLPIQKKLEKQVEDMHWQIKAKEAQIRRIAAEKVSQEGPAFTEALVAKRAAKIENKPMTAPRPEGVKEPRRKAPEAHALHGAKSHERIGQILMSSAEVPAPVVLPREERLASKPSLKSAEKPALVSNEKTVETLNRAELLQLSEKIMVEGSSLRQIYETHLIGERGLRRLVTEHLRGGDMAKALKREITEREIDFERDPVMRDLPAGTAAASGNSGGAADGKTALNQMVEKAAATLPAASEEAAFYRARAAYEIEQSNKQRQQSRVIDVAFGTIILALLAAVAYLFIARS